MKQTKQINLNPSAFVGEKEILKEKAKNWDLSTLLYFYLYICDTGDFMFDVREGERVSGQILMPNTGELTALINYTF